MKPVLLKIIQQLLLFSFLFTSLKSYTQSVLYDYIKLGLGNNQSIKEQDFELEKSIYALQEAKSLFLPNVAFSTSYTRANGGRTIDIPVGDLLNKAYATLNTLTGASNFPHSKIKKSN